MKALFIAQQSGYLTDHLLGFPSIETKTQFAEKFASFSIGRRLEKIYSVKYHG